MASAGLIVVMGFFMFINIAVIKYKFENRRIADAWFDTAVLLGLGWWLSDSISGIAMATIASACFSAWLLISPPNLDWLEDEE